MALMTLGVASWILATVIGALATWLFLQRKPANMPPGPWLSLPFLGHIPFLGHYPWISLARMREKYGNILTIRAGPMGFNYGTMLSVVLNDFDSIKAALTDQADEFEGRGTDPATEFFSTGKDGNIHGIMNMEGAKLYAQHNFIVNTFRELGVKGSRIDKLILDEFDQLADALVRHGKGGTEGLDVISDIKQATMNIIGMILFGKRYDYEEKKFQSPGGQAGIATMIGINLQRVKCLPGFVAKKLHHTSELWNVIESTLREQTKNRQRGELRNFLDASIEPHQEGDNKEGLLAMSNEDDAIATATGIFGAGTEATAVVLIYAVFYHVRNTERQKRLQIELDRVAAGRNSISYEDKEQLPYVSSTMFEVTRMSGQTPLGQARENPREARLLGYTIPAKTQIIPNYWAVHFDQKYFPDPFSFKPDRFLTNGGTSYELPPQFIHWSRGLGRRTCPGVELGQHIVWVLMANLFHRFEFSVPEGETLPGIHEYSNLLVAHRPKPFKVLVKPRKP